MLWKKEIYILFRISIQFQIRLKKKTYNWTINDLVSRRSKQKVGNYSMNVDIMRIKKKKWLKKIIDRNPFLKIKTEVSEKGGKFSTLLVRIREND